MTSWVRQAIDLRSAGEDVALVTVARVRGSAPREIGARMLVTARETIGTIGGGQLEYQCSQIACELLRGDGAAPLALRRFPLGAYCGQCCGGVVDILFEDLSQAEARLRSLGDAELSGERILHCARQVAGGEPERFVASDGAALSDSTGAADAALRSLADGMTRRVELDRGGFVLIEPQIANDFQIAVFGAGHVGSAAVAILATLDADIRWIDNRPGVLPAATPGNVQTLLSRSSENEVAAMPAGSYFLVMTHSHPLDYEICKAVLARRDAAYLGLIGSRSKRRRFEKRFRAEGIGGLDRLICPIGIEGISGKKPAEIALAAAAEILRIREAAGCRYETNVHSIDAGLKRG